MYTFSLCSLHYAGVVPLAADQQHSPLTPYRTPRRLRVIFTLPTMSGRYILSLFLVVLLAPFALAIKFILPPARFPVGKCIWNAAHTHALVIVTANVGPGPSQRVDIEIIDSTPQQNVYLSKRDIKGETRLAVTAHADGEVGVCFKNWLSPGECRLHEATSHVLKR